MPNVDLLRLANAALDELKAVNPTILDVRSKTSITDYMVIVSGTSERHLQALADAVLRRAREQGIEPLGIEGQRGGEWVLVDLGDVIVHVMLPQARAHYQLEKLWTAELSEETGAGGRAPGLPRRVG